MVDFWLPFGTPFDPFGLLLAPFGFHFGSFWLHFGPFRLHVGTLLVHFGPFLGHFAPSGLHLGPFWATFLVFGAEIHKNTQKLTLASNFLQIVVCKLSSLGPGAELLPQATEIDPGAHQGRLIMHFWSFLGDVEKSWFFDVALGRQKIEKIGPWSALGSKK